jgi:5'-nucleotidase
VGRPGPQCTTTITGRRTGPLTVSTGLTCLDNATITGAVTVRPGASLIATGGRITGPVTATQPALFTLSGTTVLGPVTVTVATGPVLIEDATITGPVTLIGNTGGVRIDTATITGPVTLLLNGGAEPIVVAANKVTGPLSCLGNQPAPGNESRRNTVRGIASGQCAKL